MKPILLLSDEPEIVRLMLKQVTSGGLFLERGDAPRFFGQALATLIQNFGGNGDATESEGHRLQL